MSHQPEKKTGILQIYRQQILLYESRILSLKKNKRILAAARFLTVVAGMLAFRSLWPSSIPVFLASLIFISLFLYLVFRDADQSAAIKNFEFLIRVNRHELDAMTQNLNGYDNGQSFAEAGHAYASDLDLFGESSLYQWISRCHSEQSKQLLSERMKNFIPIPEISRTQQASKELSGNRVVCQQIQATAMSNPLRLQTERKIRIWIDSPAVGYDRSFWPIFQNIYPIVPACVFTLYIFDYLPANGLFFCLLLLSAFIYFITRKIQPEFEMISRIQPEMETIEKQLGLIEKENFSSELLQSLQQKLRPAGNSSASAAIKDFSNILKRVEWRSNLVVGPLLSLFLLWDLRQIISLTQWKKKNKTQFSNWCPVIAETEYLISLASLVHNEPDWCFPGADTNYFHFHAREIGHPLIPPENRITNDFSIEGHGKIALITGSNMAGKSTFLRSLGINTVLAMMGAPVCARRMELSDSAMVSSMRVADNLAENTSTFYAELKKLKYIIEMIQQKKQVFILLDEVLRGTNSDDRHKGTRALIRQLLHSKSVTVMATHDTDLAHSESSDPSVSNYHFEGTITGEELNFDYKIKNGICISLNATALMKKIGIHFQD